MERKIALITGASSDIGRGLVKKLLATECHVYGQFYSNDAALNDFKGHDNFKAIKQNLDGAQQALELIRCVADQTDRLDILINAIGPFHYQSLHEMTPQSWQEQIHFNLNIAFYLSHYARDFLISSKGHIINFAFAGAEILSARLHAVPYSIAKAGIVILTKSLAKALAPQQVRVNAISPGLIEEGETNSVVRQNMAKDIPFGRVGTPDEVAQVLTWLLFRSPSYITGALVPVSGAWEFI